MVWIALIVSIVGMGLELAGLLGSGASSIYTWIGIVLILVAGLAWGCCPGGKCKT